jgi:hypothetical protein
MSSRTIYTLSLTTILVVAVSLSVSNGQAQKKTGLMNGGKALNIITSVPRIMTYQAILKDIDGEPIPNESKEMTFRIYDDPAAGELAWNETIEITTDDGGYFGAALSNLDIPFDQEYWLEIEIDGETLMPRQKLTMSAYAARADTADYAFNAAGDGNGWIDEGTVVRLETSSDTVGIGVVSPIGKLDVAGQSIFRRAEGVLDQIVFGVNDPNVALELRSGTTGGTPFIDFANDDITDFDARIRLREDGLLAVEGMESVNLQVDGQLRADKSLLGAAAPSEDLDVMRSYYIYRGSSPSPYDYQGSALRARMTFGGDATDPVGTGHGITSECVMLESGNSENEMAPLFLGCIAHAPCRLWGVDLNVHGPVNGQANLLQGLVNFVNNYNAAPIPNKGVGMAIVTKAGSGGSATPEQQMSQTYPLDIGLGIVGLSGTPDQMIRTQGYNVALQIGGNASGWMGGPETSVIGTGILVRDVETAGIKFKDFLNAATSALSLDVPIVMRVSEGDVDKWQLSQEGSDVEAAFLLRDLTEDDEWWWAAMAGGDKRLSFQKDRMVVMRDGNVGIGTPTPDNILTVAQSSDTDPIADSWTTYSSKRWKENVTPIDDALEKVCALNGIYFCWKKTGEHDLGMVAEDVGKVIPEVVNYEENGIDALSIDYARLSPLLVEAVKELKQENERLKLRLAILESKQQKMTSR